jgi:hypothetical protein
VVADARHLLVDIDPARRGINADPAPAAEARLWADLNDRRDQVRRELMVLATGHSSAEVRSLTQRLEAELFMAAVQTEWFVRDALRGQVRPEQHDIAVRCHEAAVATCDELERAVQTAGA